MLSDSRNLQELSITDGVTTARVCRPRSERTEPALLFLTTLNGLLIIITTTAIQRVESTPQGSRLHLRRGTLDVAEPAGEVECRLQADDLLCRTTGRP